MPGVKKVATMPKDTIRNRSKQKFKQPVPIATPKPFKQRRPQA